MLRLTLAINTDVIGDWEVRNVGEIEGLNGFYRYEVRPIVDGAADGAPVAAVVHHRAGGAGVLAQLVLRALGGAVIPAGWRRPPHCGCRAYRLEFGLPLVEPDDRLHTPTGCG